MASMPLFSGRADPDRLLTVSELTGQIKAVLQADFADVGLTGEITGLGVLRMLEEGRDLQEIVNQLKAVSRALDRAGFAIIANELRESARKGEVTEDELDQLERFFLSLA